MSDEQPQPWEQRPKETAKAYAAFVVYLGFGPARSHEKTRVELGKNSGYTRHLEAWSSRYEWVARAAEFDSHELKAKIEARSERREQSREMIGERVFKLVEELLNIGEGKKYEEDPRSVSAQRAAIRDALELYGVTVPKQVEVTGKGGAPLIPETDARTALRELLTDNDARAALRTLAEKRAEQAK